MQLNCFHLSLGFLVLMFSSFQTAFAQGKGALGVGGKRVALGYTETRFNDIKASTINKFDKANGFSLDYDMGLPLSIGMGFNLFQNKDVKVTWNGTPDTPVELYGYLIRIGAKFVFPIPIFQPWVGAGYSFGVITYSNPRDRTASDLNVLIYSKGSQTVKQPYYTAGVDLVLGDSGLRVGATQFPMTSNKVEEINHEPYDATLISYFAGIFVPL